LNQAGFSSPRYADSFRCIGAACEDTCCQGWKVAVDEATYLRYRDLPQSPLRTLIHANLERAPDNGKTASPFAIIRMTPANQCPMLSEERLCQIQSACGASFLSHACATYPRTVHPHHGGRLVALTLSCPEAARLVLLHPNLLGTFASSEDSTDRIDDSSQDSSIAPAGLDPASLNPWAEPIRSTVLMTVVNRAYPLWQRLFLLGIFTRRLDAITAGDLPRQPDAFLADFHLTVARGSFRPAMQAMPANELAQMDALLQLAGLMLHRSNFTPRFVDCVNAFTSGIGNGPGATLATLATHARVAHERYFAPFLRRAPQILENYLINAILRLNFPFGAARDVQESAQPMSRRFSVLAAQFALIRGLLIGVAGHFREQFSAEHLVHTVQAASKHFEHHPEFEKEVLSLLAELKLDEARGLALLLREPEPTDILHAAIQPPHSPQPHSGAAHVIF
jgi:lysine-N-methylase